MAHTPKTAGQTTGAAASAPSTPPSSPPASTITATATATETFTVPPFDGAADITRIDQAKALVLQLKTLLQTILLGTLTAAQSRALLKARLAGANLVPTLVNLLSTRPNLAPNGTDAATIQAQFKVLQAYMAFASVLGGVNTQVQDTGRQLQTQMYKMALDVYAIAERSTSNDGEVQGVVTQVKTAMKTGPRDPKKKVTSLPKPVSVKYPSAAAAAAAQAAVAAAAAGSGSAPAGSGPSNGGSSNGSASTAGNTTATSGTPASTTSQAPTVPVYGPTGLLGSAPPTNGGTTGSSK